MHFSPGHQSRAAELALRILLSLLIRIAYSLRAQTAPNTTWPTYGGDPGGQRYSSAAQITPADGTQLRPAWTFRTHSLESSRLGSKMAAFEALPVLAGHTLYLTPFDQIIALNATTGKPRWQYDPQLAQGLDAPIYTSRGIALWSDPANSAAPCFNASFRHPRRPAPRQKRHDLRPRAELRQGKLPVPAQSTPITHILNGKQYVVVAAGGHGGFGTPTGDSLIAFTLP